MAFSASLSWYQRHGSLCGVCREEEKGRAFRASMEAWEVRQLLDRYLRHTGNVQGAMLLYEEHVRWRRSKGLAPVDWAPGIRGIIPPPSPTRKTQ